MTLEELLAKPDWMRRAACVGLPTEWFFPEQGGDYRKAKAICASCPVKAECKEAGQYERFGVWGVGGEKQRKFARREIPINHGTDGGYRTHLRRGEDACDDCRRAHSAYVQIQKNPSARRPGRPIGGEWGVNLTGTFGRRRQIEENDVA